MFHVTYVDGVFDEKTPSTFASSLKKDAFCYIITVKVPDSSHEPERACTGWLMDIGRASLYKQGERQLGLRIQAVIAGARSVRSNQLLSSVMIRPTGGIISVYGKSPGQQPWARACLHVMAHGCLSMQNGCQWQAFCILNGLEKLHEKRRL